MKSRVIRSLVLSLSIAAPLSAHAQSDVSLWLTNPDRSVLFQPQVPIDRKSVV